MVHADFEACTKPISDCEPISDGSFTKNIKSINHVGSAIILSASVISFILKGQSSTEKIVRMKMLLRPSLKCPRRTSRIFIRNSILP